MSAFLYYARKVIPENIPAVLAHQIALAHTEHAGKGGIDMRDDAVYISNEQTVCHVIDDRGKIGKSVLQFDNRVLERELISFEYLREFQRHGLHGVCQQTYFII